MHRYASERVHLWVFEPNVDARRFYTHLGGDSVERAVVEAPVGGTIAAWRVVWDNPEQLLRATARLPQKGWCCDDLASRVLEGPSGRIRCCGGT